MTQPPVRPSPVYFTTALLLAAVAARAQAPDDFRAQASLFDDDHGAPLEVRELGYERLDGGTEIRDITFSPAPGREPVKAYIVEPVARTPCAGILWLHWLGEPETTNRTQFLAEAIRLAPRGVVSLLVDAMWAAPDWYANRVPEKDFEGSLRQVIAILRAMDVLISQPRVDRARVGVVGHDYGGMYGMIASGVAPRAKAYVFIATASSLNDWAFFARQPVSKAAYLRQNADLELTDYARRIKNAATLLQFAKSDAYVSRSDTAVLLAAFNEPKERRFYDADHAMTPAVVSEERDAWLIDHLGLDPLGAPAMTPGKE